MTADQEPTVFEVVDWQGVFVRCSRRDWDRVIQKHPDMRERLRDVIEPVRAPDLVARDRDISVHVVFYRRSQGVAWQKVIVRYVDTPGELRGSFVTAFRTRRMRSGDEVLYRRDDG